MEDGEAGVDDAEGGFDKGPEGGALVAVGEVGVVELVEGDDADEGDDTDAVRVSEVLFSLLERSERGMYEGEVFDREG